MVILFCFLFMTHNFWLEAEYLCNKLPQLCVLVSPHPLGPCYCYLLIYLLSDSLDYFGGIYFLKHTVLSFCCFSLGLLEKAYSHPAVTVVLVELYSSKIDILNNSISINEIKFVLKKTPYKENTGP